MLLGLTKYRNIAHDPLFSLVRALLPFDGGINGTPVFIDVIGNIWTALVGTPVLSTTRSKWGTSSLFLNGNSQGIVATNARLALGNGDYCIECWLWSAGLGISQFTQKLVDYRSAEPQDTPEIELEPGEVDSAGAVYINGAVRVTGNVKIIGRTIWQHIAVYRSSGITRFATGGMLSSSSYNSSSNYTQTKCNMGSQFIATSGDWRSINGYISDFRITAGAVGSGAARYGASNFTPPTAPFPTS